MIRFQCQCGHQYKVPDYYVGKKVRCKKCNTINRIVPVPEVTDESENVEQESRPENYKRYIILAVSTGIFILVAIAIPIVFKTIPKVKSSIQQSRIEAQQRKQEKQLKKQEAERQKKLLAKQKEKEEAEAKKIAYRLSIKHIYNKLKDMERMCIIIKYKWREELGSDRKIDYSTKIPCLEDFAGEARLLLQYCEESERRREDYEWVQYYSFDPVVPKQDRQMLIEIYKAFQKFSEGEQVSSGKYINERQYDGAFYVISAIEEYEKLYGEKK